jgi:hypothetical protein
VYNLNYRLKAFGGRNFKRNCVWGYAKKKDSMPVQQFSQNVNRYNEMNAVAVENYLG